MKPLFSSLLIGALLVAFVAFAGCGVYLIGTSVEPKANRKPPSASKVDVDVSPKGVKLKLTTAIPGLVVFVVSAAGLLLLTIRVPVKQVRGYRGVRQAPGAASRVGLQYRFAETPEPILNDQTERVPLLLWWAIRKRGIAVEVQDPPRPG
jgi:hypothetical protein